MHQLMQFVAFAVKKNGKKRLIGRVVFFPIDESYISLNGDGRQLLVDVSVLRVHLLYPRRSYITVVRF